MIYEKKEGSIDTCGDKRSTVYYGTLTVSGKGSLMIPCRGKPYEVEVGFSDPVPPSPGCGPTPVDTVDIEIEHIKMPFPLYAIRISWEVNSSNIREITWKATVLRSMV